MELQSQMSGSQLDRQFATFQAVSMCKEQRKQFKYTPFFIGRLLQ